MRIGRGWLRSLRLGVMRMTEWLCEEDGEGEFGDVVGFGVRDGL
jgi:hypothetical protein